MRFVNNKKIIEILSFNKEWHKLDKCSCIWLGIGDTQNKGIRLSLNELDLDIPTVARYLQWIMQRNYNFLNIFFKYY